MNYHLLDDEAKRALGIMETTEDYWKRYYFPECPKCGTKAQEDYTKALEDNVDYKTAGRLDLIVDAQPENDPIVNVRYSEHGKLVTLEVICPQCGNMWCMRKGFVKFTPEERLDYIQRRQQEEATELHEMEQRRAFRMITSVNPGKPRPARKESKSESE